MCEGHWRRPLSHRGHSVCMSVCVLACPCVHVRGGCRCQGDAMVTRCQPTSWRCLSRSGSAFVLHSWWQASLMPPSAANWTRQQRRWDRGSVWWLSGSPHRSLCFVRMEECAEESESNRARERLLDGRMEWIGWRPWIIYGPNLFSGQLGLIAPPNSWLYSPCTHTQTHRGEARINPRQKIKGQLLTY